MVGLIGTEIDKQIVTDLKITGIETEKRLLPHLQQLVICGQEGEQPIYAVQSIVEGLLFLEDKTHVAFKSVRGGFDRELIRNRDNIRVDGTVTGRIMEMMLAEMEEAAKAMKDDEAVELERVAIKPSAEISQDSPDPLELGQLEDPLELGQLERVRVARNGSYNSTFYSSGIFVIDPERFDWTTFASDSYWKGCELGWKTWSKTRYGMCCDPYGYGDVSAIATTTCSGYQNQGDDCCWYSCC